jgi:16S rRNA (uracil1498-N3)-methyltransferase
VDAAKAHALVDDVEHPELHEQDRHHLVRVLRLRDGDVITVTDGAGRWRACRLATELDPVGDIRFEAAPSPQVTIGFALVKGERPELVVQKLTELGVDRIVPFVADRSVVRWDDEKATRNHERLVAVAREAVMQSRRTWVPVVEALATFDELARCAGASMADRDGVPPSLAHPTLLIGPEGGWSERERAVEVPHIRLGDNVLRAETASISAAVALCGLRSNVFAPTTAIRG